MTHRRADGVRSRGRLPALLVALGALGAALAVASRLLERVGSDGSRTPSPASVVARDASGVAAAEESASLRRPSDAVNTRSTSADDVDAIAGHPTSALRHGPIAGRVSSRASGEPLTELVVRLREAGGGQDWDLAELHRVSSTTGEFDLGRRPAGEYELRVTSPGHDPLESGRIEVPGAESLELTLSTGASIRGGVSDARGRAAADVPVELHPVGEWEAIPFVKRAVTDAAGEYRFSALETGGWRVLVADPHGGPEPLHRSRVLTAAGDEEQRWDLRLPPATDVVVHVTCGGEPAAPGTRASVLGRNGVAAQVRVGGGVARFDRLPPGAYELVIRHGGGEVAHRESVRVPEQPEPFEWTVDVAPAAPPLADG